MKSLRLGILGALAALVLTPAAASAQATVCTYAEQNGAVKNCVGMQNAGPPVTIADQDSTPVTVTPQSAVGVIWTANTTGYSGVGYVTNTGWSASTITFEGSNDSTDGTNGTWTNIAGQQVNTSTPVTGTQSTNTPFFIPATTVWVRARVSTFSTGPVGGSAFLRSLPPILISNTINNNKAIWYTESNGTVSVAVGANQNGASRDTGAAGSDYRFANWSCLANPTVSSTGAFLAAQGSLDGTNWVTTQSVAATTAGVTSTTQNRIFFRYNRCVFNNTGGSAASNVFLMAQYGE